MAASTRALPLEGARTLSGADASSAFDYAVLAAIAWFIGGLLIDGWAHNNLDLSKEGFFTPYHAVFYSGFAAVASVVLLRTWRNRKAGASLVEAVPRGYVTTLVGLGIFAVGGVLDMTWHIVFGVEQDIEALYSPTHLILAIGIGSILCGPIRSVELRAPARSWRAQLPAIAAIVLFATIASFFFMWAFGTAAGNGANPKVVFPSLGAAALSTLRDYQIQHGITAIVIRSFIFIAPLIWAVRRFAVPRGALALAIFFPAVAIGTMLSPSLDFVGLQAASALVAALVAEVLYARLPGIGTAPIPTRIFGAAVPFAFWATYMPVSWVVAGGLWWSPHVVYGAPVIAALSGLVLALVLERPAVSNARAPGLAA